MNPRNTVLGILTAGVIAAGALALTGDADAAPARPYDDKTDGVWPELSSRWEGKPRVIITEGDAEWFGYLDGATPVKSVQKTLGAEDLARVEATATAKAVVRTKELRRAALTAKAKAGTLTAAEVQEALSFALGGG